MMASMAALLGILSVDESGSSEKEKLCFHSGIEPSQEGVKTIVLVLTTGTKP